MPGVNAPSAMESPQGRRVLVAVVGGEAGERIQRWREDHDPVQARRIPPHATLCYWVTGIDLDALDRQVRHAFPEAIAVRLRGHGEFEGTQHTLYVPVEQVSQLSAARERLYDGTFAELGPAGNWTWHVTCVRDAMGLDIEALRESAERELSFDMEWHIDHIACLELRGECYEPVREWRW